MEIRAHSLIRRLSASPGRIMHARTRFAASSWRRTVCAVALLAAALPCLAAEHVTLRNGFELDCTRREIVGDRVRLYTGADALSYMELSANAVVRVEVLADAAPPSTPPNAPRKTSPASSASDILTLVASAGAAHHIDADLLSSVIHAESAGKVHAVSRTGARGLMQLMPATATAMGVSDAFAPEQNISGGTAYLDQLLTRYHDDLVLAVAAYNAGPGAVARWHGVPPYPETRAYVARVVREFNRRKLAAR